MDNIILNLARKWRSKQFDEIIGQDLAVKLLKNSLYRNLVFPVYLFSGPKGTGKTSLARIFSSSLNCEILIDFQNRPQDIKLPCLICKSCIAMQKLAHPDFIEIDAASHTGVDNIRHIIETASFVPVTGKKKIYLIDEAHMLSKSAFNALLKILEEPPPSTIFILATTDEHKVIETVKSRCFQLFFSAISPDHITHYLEFICNQEKILFEKDGLDIIAKESDGSVRDALNIIERVRLVHTSINKNTVFQTLGFLDEERLLEFLKHIVNQDIKELLLLCSTINLKQYNSQIIFKCIIELIRNSLLIKIGSSKNLQNNLREKLETLTKNCSIEHLVSLLDLCCSYELIFAKTNAPDLALEILLIKLTQKKSSSGEGRGSSPNLDNQNIEKKFNRENFPQKIEILSESTINQNVLNLADNQDNNLSQWDTFLAKLELTNDPLVLSVFKQAKFEQIIDKSNQIKLTFNKDLMFFQDWIENTKNSWKPIIDSCFNCDIEIITQYDESVTKKIIVNNAAKSENSNANGPTHVQASTNNINYKKKDFSMHSLKQTNKDTKLNISDIEKWKTANMLVKLFPGSNIYLINENKRN